jgi:single-stranded-DNA-specific exonuclease
LLAEISKTESASRVVDRIVDAINTNKRITVYGDYDTDGLSALLVMGEMFKLIGYSNHVLYEYIDKTRNLDSNFINFCLLKEIDFYIVCDTGSSDLETLKLLKVQGLTGVILDHHDIGCSLLELQECVDILNSTLEEQTSGVPDDYCGGSLAWVVACMVLDKLGVQYDAGFLGTFALLAQYADSIPMDSTFGKSLYQTVMKRKSTPLAIEVFLNDRPFNRRMIEYTIAPKINGAFKNGALGIINSTFLRDSGEDIYNGIVSLSSLHREIIDMVDVLVNSVSVVNWENCTFVNLSEMVGVTKLSLRQLCNYKGRIASHFVEKNQKPCICVCDNGAKLEGSFRAPIGVDYLSLFKPICECGGHAAAFGFRIGYYEWDFFSRTVQRVMNLADRTSTYREFIHDMSFGFDYPLTSEIAIRNEFSSERSPRELVRYSFPKLVESTKYGFGYLVYDDGINKLWCDSKYRIDDGTGVLLYPYLGASLKLSVVWRS